MNPNGATSTLSIGIPPELVEAAAERAAEILAERQGGLEGERWLRGAERIAEYIDAPMSRVYALASARRIPIHRDGSALVARSSELDGWVRGGGGRRP